MPITDIDNLMKCFSEMTGKTVPDEESELWRGLCTYKLFPARKILLRQGDLPTECFFVLKGLCRQYYIDDAGDDITRGFIPENGFCCTEALIEGDSSRYYIETLEECRTLAFRPRELQARLGGSVYMRDVYINALILNIRSRIRRDEMFMTCSASERYRLFNETYPDLAGRVKQIHLASYLGVNQVTLSRIRRSLRENDGSSAV